MNIKATQAAEYFASWHEEHELEPGMLVEPKFPSIDCIAWKHVEWCLLLEPLDKIYDAAEFARTPEDLCDRHAAFEYDCRIMIQYRGHDGSPKLALMLYSSRMLRPFIAATGSTH